MVAAAPAAVSSVLHLLTAGRTMQTSTRRAGSYGPSNRSTVAEFHGPIFLFLSAMSHSSRWASRRSVLAAAARTRGNHKNSTGDLKARGLETNGTAANASFRSQDRKSTRLNSSHI